MIVDCRESKSARRVPLYYRRAGVVCGVCRWRGYRKVEVTANFKQRVNKLVISDKLRGRDSTKRCPLCGGRVIFVYVTNGIDKPRRT